VRTAQLDCTDTTELSLTATDDTPLSSPTTVPATGTDAPPVPSPGFEPQHFTPPAAVTAQECAFPAATETACADAGTLGMTAFDGGETTVPTLFVAVTVNV
jgi:hypothetical protein